MRPIDADALKGKKVHGTIGNVSGDFIPAFEIALAPTIDAVEVVRCKNCKHREDRLYCRLHKHPVIVTNTDFCSYGRRKDDETD